jgi:alpha-D-xyloside xylohydrolase
MGFFTHAEQTLTWRENQVHLWIRPWGRDGLRVQSNLAGQPLDLPQALLAVEPPPAGAVSIAVGEKEAVIRNGLAEARVRADGRVRFFKHQSGGPSASAEADGLLLEEPEPHYYAPPARSFKARDGKLYEIQARFAAQDGERFWGLGQHQHGRLDQKGCVVELQQRNTEVTIPFAVSSRGYGFLWNNPGVGRVELAMNGTRWTAFGSQQLDYYLVVGDSAAPGGEYASILARYADATGHAPELPGFASGFWQCKLRYRTQEELLKVAREYKRRGLPLSVIVIDFFNWSHMGDWRFDPACWPDPAAMTRELEELGVKAMVSIWPTVSPISENYAEMKEHGLLINNERGTDAQHVFLDHGINGPAYFLYYDSTNPEARRFIWQTAKRGYYDQGVKLYWLDNDEPDINPWDPENLRYHLGNGLEVGNLYPLLNQQAFFDGLREAGESEIVTLSRSTWAGGQRYSSVVWSGDIASTFADLNKQVRAGLGMAMSGYPWWTTDIGGFHSSDIYSETFQELIVRWFQFGLFCPIMRLHGFRGPTDQPMIVSGLDNEVWSFGEETYQRIAPLLFLRERLRPYIHAQMRIASQTGLPVMRPLFVDFPADPTCQAIDDQYLFGAEILVAPVLQQGQRERPVYLPAGAKWTDAWTGEVFDGGQWIKVDAPLEKVPVFLKEGSELGRLFR